MYNNPISNFVFIDIFCVGVKGNLFIIFRIIKLFWHSFNILTSIYIIQDNNFELLINYLPIVYPGDQNGK